MSEYQEEVWINMYGDLFVIKFFFNDGAAGDINNSIKYFIEIFGGEFLGIL